MEVLEILRAAARPGVTTGELDALAARELAKRHATSNFKGYTPVQGIPPFPGVICASVDERDRSWHPWQAGAQRGRYPGD